VKEQLSKANYRITNKFGLDPFNRFVKGMRYKNLNQSDKAKISLLEYLDLKPKSNAAYLQLGIIH
jgi:hypothetical protein